MMALGELAGLLGGELRNGDAAFDGVTIDSRTIAGGELFVDHRDTIAAAAPADRTCARKSWAS